MKNLLIATALLATTSANAQTKPAPFKNGDRIVLMGNSITENGFYGLYIWQYYMLHFPERKITIFNAGIGGDVAGQLLSRFDDDVTKRNPTVVAVTFGMNDSRYFEYNNKPQEEVRKEAVATSYKSYQGIEAKLKALPNVKKVIVTSSPYDETVTGPQNNFHGKYTTMLEIAKFQEASAKANNWSFVDLMRPMTVIDQREQKRDTNFTLTGTDRIHPGNAGHFAMAYLFLKAQGLANTVVADVNINTTTGKLVKAVNSTVTNIKNGKGNISFDYKAKSLPFPSDSNARVWQNPQKQYEALSVIPFTEEFNKEMLKLGGLKADQQYALSIDGQSIGTLSGSEFGKGINLAVLSNTPQYQQAKQIAELNFQYRDLEQKLRGYYWLQFNFFRAKNMYFQDDQAAVDSVDNNGGRNWAVDSKKGYYHDTWKKESRAALQKELDAILDKIYTMNKPVTHKFVVTLVK